MVISSLVFIHQFFDYCKYFLSKQWNSSSDAWSFVHIGNLTCWLPLDQQGEEFANLCNAISLTFERENEVNCNLVCIG